MWQVRALSGKGRGGAAAEPRSFTVLFVPRRTIICEKAPCPASRAPWTAVPCTNRSTRCATSPAAAERRSPLCPPWRAPFQILEEEGVYGDLLLGDFRLGFVPVEPDFLLLEQGDFLRESAVEGDSSEVFYTARALETLQARLILILVLTLILIFGFGSRF